MSPNPWLIQPRANAPAALPTLNLLTTFDLYKEQLYTPALGGPQAYA